MLFLHFIYLCHINNTNMKGKYTEKLEALNANLIVENSNYYISFYFPGPDLRYNGSFFSIYAQEIDQYIIALKKNWLKYLELEKVLLPGEFNITGEMGMKIVRGEYFKGVSLYSFNFFISTEKEMNLVIKELQFAKERGIYLQKFLSEIH